VRILIGYGGSHGADAASAMAGKLLAEHGARLADTAVDLVVLGARGLAGVRAFLGSVSNHGQHTRRPVLVVPARSAS
jgi:nucleotide-binding universal stress UspA family protein